MEKEKCIVCGEDIVKNKIPRIAPIISDQLTSTVIDKIELSDFFTSKSYPVCNKCGNIISLIFIAYRNSYGVFCADVEEKINEDSD